MSKLFQLEKQQKLIKKAISEEKRKENKRFIKEHKTIIRILDIAMIFIILFNYGALTITNAMVLKKEPDRIFYEVNPVVAESNDYVVHPKAQTKIKQLVRVFIAWAVLIGIYVYFRLTIMTTKDLIVLVCIVATWFMILGWDFVNDFGFWIGKQIWGG